MTYAFAARGSVNHLVGDEELRLRLPLSQVHLRHQKVLHNQSLTHVCQSLWCKELFEHNGDMAAFL